MQIGYGDDSQEDMVQNTSLVVSTRMVVRDTESDSATSEQSAGNGQTQSVELYVGNNIQCVVDLYDALDWIALNAQSGGNYSIILGKDQTIIPRDLSYGDKTVTISLKSASGQCMIRFEGNSPSYSLFTINPGVTFILEEGVTLSGSQNDADKSLVKVA